MKCIARLFAGLFILGAASAAIADGNFKCDVPKAERRQQMELKEKLLADGWKKVRQIKVENGCYEVYGFNEKNERAEVFFHPRTFEKVGQVK